jgi:hypothetical protein
VTGVLAASWRTRLSLAARYDDDSEASGWTLVGRCGGDLRSLDQYATAGGPETRSDVSEISNATREWYFGEGGLLLSRPSQKRFVELRLRLEAAGRPGAVREVDPSSSRATARARTRLALGKLDDFCLAVCQPRQCVGDGGFAIATEQLAKLLSVGRRPQEDRRSHLLLARLPGCPGLERDLAEPLNTLMQRGRNARAEGRYGVRVD